MGDNGVHSPALFRRIWHKSCHHFTWNPQGLTCYIGVFWRRDRRRLPVAIKGRFWVCGWIRFEETQGIYWGCLNCPLAGQCVKFLSRNPLCGWTNTRTFSRNVFSIPHTPHLTPCWTIHLLARFRLPLTIQGRILVTRWCPPYCQCQKNVNSQISSFLDEIIAECVQTCDH